MSAATPSPEPLETANPMDAWERALLDRQLEALSRLAEMGMAIAGVIERRVLATEAGPEPVAALEHAALAFSRVARAVRQTFALQSRLIADFKAKPKAAEADEDDRGPLRLSWLEPVPVEADAVRRSVREAAEAAGHDSETVERLQREAAERLEDDDIYRELRTRAVGEIVARIRRDLGLEPEAADPPDPVWDPPPPVPEAPGAMGPDPARWRRPPSPPLRPDS